MGGFGGIRAPGKLIPTGFTQLAVGNALEAAVESDQLGVYNQRLRDLK